ncbi:MAG: hypothetical protein ACM32H_08930, partial [Candidatus Aminicenantes bacterium RBG_16_66_30]
MRRVGKRGTRFFFLALAALFALALIAAAGPGRPGPSGQAKSDAPQATLRHEVTVTLKLIQVFVTDA